MYYFIPCIGHLENTGWLSNIVLPHADTSHYTSWKKKYINITMDLIRKSLSTGKLSSSRRQTQVFQISNFHLIPWILSLATNTIISFEKVSAKYSKWNNHSVPVVLSRIYSVPWKKWSIQRLSLVLFPLDNHHLFKNEA